jgi:hypothetical protein
MDNKFYSSIDDIDMIFEIFETAIDVIDSDFDIEDTIIEEFGDAGKKLKKESLKSLKIANKKLFKECKQKSKAAKNKALELYHRNKSEEAKKAMSDAVTEIDKYINKITENCNECIKILDDHGYSKQADKYEKMRNNYTNKLEKIRNLLEENKRYVDMRNVTTKKYDSVLKRPKELSRPKKEENNENVKESVLIEDTSIDNIVNINLGIIKHLMESKKYDDAKYFIADSLYIHEKNKDIITNSEIKKSLLDYYNEKVNEMKYNSEITLNDDIYEEAVSLVKMTKTQLKLRSYYPAYITLSFELKKNLYSLFNAFKNNNKDIIVHELDCMDSVIKEMVHDLKLIKLINDIEINSLISNQILIDAFDATYYFSLFTRVYSDNEYSDKLSDNALTICNTKASDNMDVLHAKLFNKQANPLYDNFNEVINLAIMSYKTILETISVLYKSLNDENIKFNIMDKPNVLKGLFENSASVVGSLLPQGCGYDDTFNSYTESLPKSVTEGMFELEEHSEMYLERLNDLLNFNKNNTSEKKLNNKKIKEICAIHNKKMIAKGNIDLIKTTNRDYKKDSVYIKNSKDYRLYDAQFKLKYKLLNSSEKEYVNSYIDGFDSSIQKRLNNNKKSVKKESVEMFNDDYVVITETANIDKEIANVIAILNAKGFKTQYSSAGHAQLRKKTDRDRDGVYYDKLYTDARIMFKDNYRFPEPPKHWKIKNVDGVDYLQPIPRHYNEKDGNPDKAFAKWKAEYMGTLRTWVENLPEKTTTDKIFMKDGKIAESVLYDPILEDDDFYEEFFNNFLVDDLD